jgi:hypothetical protein
LSFREVTKSPYPSQAVFSDSAFWTYLEQVTGTELDDPFRDVVPKGGRKTKAAVAAERKAFPPEDILRLIKEPLH